MGSCVRSRTMFYLPYMWVATNNEYAGQTVNRYYNYVISVMFGGSGASSFGALCPTALGTGSLASQSWSTAATCPAGKMEMLKTILKVIRSLGDDLLLLGYDVTMLFASLLAMVFSPDASTTSSMTVMAFQYFGSIVTLIEATILPIIEDVLRMLLQTTAFGKVLLQILQGLCLTFNWLMSNVLAYIWCPVIRPAVFTVLTIVQDLASLFSSDVANEIYTISTALGGAEDVQTCIARFSTQYPCNFLSGDPMENASQFLPQATATICWSSATGGGLLSGQDSLLSCTASDTCAIQALSFDKSSYGSSGVEPLVNCGSCPSLDTATFAGGAYACDTYLGRCVCGRPTATPQTCIRTSDCTQNAAAVCGVSDRIDQVSTAFVTPLCSSCRALGMEPVCVVSDATRGGDCACLQNVVSLLLSCPSTAGGTNVHVVDNSQFGRLCVAALDASRSMSLKSMAYPASVTLQYSDYAVADCILATGNNMCMNVMIPYADAAAMGRSGTQHLVVLYNLIGGYGRKLLALDSIAPSAFIPALTDLLAHDEATGVRLSRSKRRIMNLTAVAMAIASSEDNTSLAYCSMKYATARQDAKACVLAHTWVAYTLRAHNLSLWYGQEGALVDMLLSGTLLRPSLASLKQLVYRPGWLWDLLHDNEYTRQLVHIPYSIFAPMAKWWQQQEPPAIHNVSVIPNVSSGASEASKKKQSMHQSMHQSMNESMNRFGVRRLLQDTPGVNLTSDVQWSLFVSNPFSSLVSFAGVTALYYTQQQYSKSMPACNDTGLVACVGYSLPPQRSTRATNAISQAADVLMMIPMLGNGGTRVIDAMLSDMPYNETVAKDYITGGRLVRDLSRCDYTVLTLGTERPKNLLAVVILVALFITLLSSFCCPFSCSTFLLWGLLFNVLVIWGAYNISPLCFPMIPPTLMRDIYVEVQMLLPKSWIVPTTFTRAGCDSDGARLSDGIYDPSCFLMCADPPFSMVSWEDTLAWWMCELSTDACTGAARWIGLTNLAPDFVSSAYYYTDVLRFSAVDQEFVSAHRFCAVFTLYNIGFVMTLFIIAAFLTPYICSAVFDLLTGVFVFLIDIQAAESVGDAD